MQEERACRRCREEVNSLQNDYRAIVPVLEAAGLSEDQRDWQSWMWAAGAVATRTMHFPGDSVGCLTPFGDMFNFGPPAPPIPPKLPLDSDYACPDTRSCHEAAAVKSDNTGVETCLAFAPVFIPFLQAFHSILTVHAHGQTRSHAP
jgi:hypothetical protein